MWAVVQWLGKLTVLERLSFCGGGVRAQSVNTEVFELYHDFWITCMDQCLHIGRQHSERAIEVFVLVR